MAATVVTLAVAQPVGAELTLEISHRARAVYPGEVVVLEVHPSEAPATLRATAFGESVRFFPISGDDDDDTWAALIGIDLTTEPGGARRGDSRDGA